MALSALQASRVIARRSRSNLTVLEDNDGGIAALLAVARNDRHLYRKESTEER